MIKKNSDEPVRSYSPYSGTEETCFIKGKSGVFYPGVRIENISFPLTIPAVQGAVCSCLANSDQPAVLYQQKTSTGGSSYWVNEFSLEVEQNVPESAKYYNPVISFHENTSGALKELSEKAIVPHSDFPVSAFLKVSGGFIPGVNVELDEWNLGLCAERVAISRAVASGYSDFEGLSLYAPKGDFSSPCGACRQILAEWLPDKKVELYHGDGSVSTHYTAHLMPYGFTSKTLKNR